MKKNSDILIKVLSLGVGLAVGVVLIAKVFFELSYDSFYKDIDRVYSIYTWYSQNGDENDYGQVSGAVAVGFMEEVPGVEVGTRTTYVFNGDTYLDEEGHKLKATLVCADTCFFKVFDRPILAGDPVKTLAKFGSVMVSRSFAGKMGGVQECIGKQICNKDVPDLKFTIEGVFEDFPKNGTLDYDILLSMASYSEWSTTNWLGNDRYRGYVKLFPGVDPNTLSDAIRKMQEAHQHLDEIEAMGLQLRYYLKPFNKLHTSHPEVKTQVILLSIVAALLILISLLNYILIVISSLVKRSKEVGVRKCYGAEGKHIYGLLSKEALLHIVLSLVLAALIIFAGRSLVENLLGVPFQTLLVPQSVMAIVAVILFVLAISRELPLLETGSFRSPGADQCIPGGDDAHHRQAVSGGVPQQSGLRLQESVLFRYLRRRLSGVVQMLEGLPEVTGVATSYNLPYRGASGNNVHIPDDSRELFNIADQYDSSDGFFELLGIPFVDGRAPRGDLEIAVDEKFVARMAEFTDWSDGAVGKQVFVTEHGPVTDDEIPYYFTITGVYKSYLIGNLQGVDPRPSVMFHGEIGTDYMPHILFKVNNPASLPAVRAALDRDCLLRRSDARGL